MLLSYFLVAFEIMLDEFRSFSKRKTRETEVLDECVTVFEKHPRISQGNNNILITSRCWKVYTGREWEGERSTAVMGVEYISREQLSCKSPVARID